MLKLAVPTGCLAAASAHLCITDPPQRGALNATRSGDPSCDRRQWPCGGLPLPPAPYPIHYIDSRNYDNGIDVVSARPRLNPCLLS